MTLQIDAVLSARYFTLSATRAQAAVLGSEDEGEEGGEVVPFPSEFENPVCCGTKPPAIERFKVQRSREK